jgi:hypothetical protein
VATPLTLSVEVDQEEYSRYETERNTILVTVSPTGTDMSGEQVRVELRKARRGRDEIVATKILTLSTPGPSLYQVEFDLNSIVDQEDIPKVRRGEYFVYAEAAADDTINATCPDFRISLVTVARLKSDYLHGTDQMATNVLTVAEQPRLITGVTVDDVSFKHAQSWFPLSYNFSIDQVPTVTGSITGPFALVNGQPLVIRLDGGAPQTITFITAQFVAIGAATATEVAAVITAAAIPGVTATVNTNKVQISGGKLSLYVDPGAAATTLGLANASATSSVTRLLSWCGGPSVAIEPGRKTYTLRRGSTGDYIVARVKSTALLPQESKTEDLLINRKPLDVSRMQAIVDQACSWFEDIGVQAYLEPTRIVTEVDPDIIAYPIDSDIPQLVGADWDEVVDAITYTSPSGKNWINFKFPYLPMIRMEELYGKISNSRVVDIALEWVARHEASGYTELVPFNQEVAWNFIGLVWVDSLRGPTPIPNFWNFTALVGFRDTPPIALELVAKKAAVDILTIAGQAFRTGISSQSVSRDGVSESVSYTQSAAQGIFAATVGEYKKFIDENTKALRGAYRGPAMVVC